MPHHPPPAAPPPKRPDEEARLGALHRYALLDTEPEPDFDDLVRLLAEICDTPIAVINLIDRDRQWFKAEVGLDGLRETPLDVSICAHALLQPGLFVVPDALLDPRFSCNPLVTAAPGLRFYAGALLESSDGLPLGTLCVLDRAPRPAGLTALQERALLVLARQVMAQAELRLLARRRTQALARSDAAAEELRAKAEALRSALARAEAAAERQRRMLREVLAFVTGGALVLCEAPAALPSPLSARPFANTTVPLSPESLGAFRRLVTAACSAAGLPRDRAEDLTLAAGEAASNAVVHGGAGGEGRVFVRAPGGAAGAGAAAVQAWVTDRGPGIAEDSLHRATLEAGFSSAGTLGHGFPLMTRLADRIHLLTGAGGTIVVLEQGHAGPAGSHA